MPGESVNPMRARFLSLTATWLIVVGCIAIPCRASGSDAPSAQGNTPFAVRKLPDLEQPQTPTLQMPTDVAVNSKGEIFVADGVNDRIVQFSADGKFVRSITGVENNALSRPLGVSVDRADQLWIADTGNSRVLAMDSAGRLVKVINVPTNPGSRSPSITDVACSTDGKSVSIVDNHNHRLIRVELATNIQTSVGRPGESLGQLNHPFMIALGSDDTIYVSDVLNGRVSVFGSAGQPSTSVGRYGADLGELYRPKGVAVDSKGNIWVSDSVTGVIQVFSARRRLIDVVRDEAGKPLHFQAPTGIAIAGNDELYVAELAADRIGKYAITRGTQADVSGKSEAVAQLTGNQARSCTVCHLEWMPPFNSGGATALMNAPPSLPDESYVSRSENCLSCHDGSMVDSRRRVWEEHGHQTGMVPPPNITVPSGLPLVQGKIACRTCHSAHVSGQFNSDVNTAVFLRVKNESSELCVSCHVDKTRGPAFGTHPTGGMPWPVPKNLVSAGAKTGANPRELTCQVCHTPHGSKQDHLLVMGTNSNELCMSCHDQMRPGMFRDDNRSEHPLRPFVNAQQAAAVKELGTKLSDDNRLICLSCHKLHHGKGEHFMLAEELTDSRFCIRCHAEKTTVLGTAHDLRTRFATEKNRLGMTPQSGGPCSSCHLFHRYARAPESSDIDPGGGKCITCHNMGAVASAKSIGPIRHPPNEACLNCHNPHQPDQAPRIYAPVASRPTDHTVALAKSEAVDRNTLCLSCHQNNGSAPMPEIASHPTVAMSTPETADTPALPLYDDAGRMSPRGFIACQTCHIMHGHLPAPADKAGAARDKEFERVLNLNGEVRSAMRLMLRPFGDTNICLDCHGKDALRRFLYFHDPQRRKGLEREAAAFNKKSRN